MNKLTNLCSPPGLQHPSEKASQVHDGDAPSWKDLQPDPKMNTESMEKLFGQLTNLAPDDMDVLEDKMLDMMATMVLTNPPPEVLQCANIDLAGETCSKPGKMACAACCLVSYCSRECQRKHWRLHKSDCKSPMRSQDWVPGWVREGSRQPAFVLKGQRPGADLNESELEEERRKKEDGFSVGISLWGKVPAIDLMNLSNNEGDPKKDLSLAFIASGDLRNVVRTVNALPWDYSGELSILINDMRVPLVCRNIVLLFILGTVSDEAMAADIALHFWYSAFMPEEYLTKISSTLTNFVQDQLSLSNPLGPISTLSYLVPKDAGRIFCDYLSPSLLVSSEYMRQEFERLRTAPDRSDFHDRKYARLRPSHRVAFQEFRRLGIVLPFGASKARFNFPNLSLFSPEGKWLEWESSDPLEGWDVEEVIKAGKAHGTRAEDVYGCFYFYITEQLRKFFRRIRQFRISFHLYCTDACQLSRSIQDGSFSLCNLPATTRFDRIEVSNLMDVSQIGLQEVLTLWGHFLVEGSTAAIVGYFAAWASVQADALPTRAGERVVRKLFNQLLEMRNSMDNKPKGHKPEYKEMESMLYTAPYDMGAIYDNSRPFRKFLAEQGLNDILKKTNLKLRETHKIVPHRIRAPLGGRQDDLPEFPDNDSWYYHTQVASIMWAGRFVEFVRQQ